MDAIDRIIHYRPYLIENLAFLKETWQDFESVAVGRKIFLYGVGEGANLYLRKYNSRFHLVGCIDNNEIMHDIPAQYFLYENLGREYQDIKVFGKSVLKNYNKDEVVVLITSLRYSDEIFRELVIYQLKHVFSLLHLEYFERKNQNINETEDCFQTLWNELSFAEIQRNKILLFSRCDGCGHVGQIAKHIYAQRPDVEFVWALDDIKTKLPVPAQKVWRGNKLALQKQIKTSKIIMDEHHLPWIVDKSQEQYFLQVKHWASITLKMFGYDFAKYHDGMTEYLNSHKELADYILVGSKFDEETCRRGFGFGGNVVYVGSPRSDILFNSSGIKTKINSRYRNLKKKLLLFAPTFRNKSNAYNPVSSDIDLDFKLVHDTLIKRFGGEWSILLRLHPVVSQYSKYISKPYFVVDVSDYNDSEELVAISDAMITDYSSIMFEPAFIRKPVFLFATDREEYLSKERGFLIPYDTLPFPIAESNEELVHNIESFDYDEYVRNVDAFMNNYGVHEDGHASERAARFILDLIDGKVHKGEARNNLDYTVAEAMSLT